MADEIRNSDPKVQVVRLIGHRDDAGAWEIRDFLKRSVVEFQWIELVTDVDSRRELGLPDLKDVDLPVAERPAGRELACRTARTWNSPSSNSPTERASSAPHCGRLPTGLASSPRPSGGST